MAIVKRKVIRNGKQTTDYYVRLMVGDTKKSWVTHSLAEAKEVQIEKKKEIKNGTIFDVIKQNDLLFKDIATRYLDFYRDTKASIDRDQRSLLHLIPYFGEKLAHKITPADIERYRKIRKQENSYRGTPTAIATINNEINCMGAIYTWAIRKERLLTYSPVKDVDKEKANNYRDRYLTQEDFEKVYNQSPDYLKPIVLTAWETGMRKMEIINLTWDRVNMQTGFIRLREEDTKTNKSRNVPMSDKLCKAFNELEERKISDSGLVFLRNGQPIKDVWEMFKVSCQRVGIKDFTFHDLRRCFISRKVYSSIPVPMIMMVTGHKTTKAFERYISGNGADLKAVVNPQNQAKLDTKMDTYDNPLFSRVA